MRIAILLLLSGAAASIGCKSAYYSTMEKFGVHKREILVDRVREGRAEQAAAQEQFQTTFEAFQKLTGFQGGDLEDLYENLSDEYEASEARADTVRDRIDSIQSVAKALFEEWRGEIDEMSDRSIQGQSEKMLADTQARYAELLSKMKRAASKMDPVLAAFKDRVLLLKHNLNARAIDSLRTEELGIHENVEALLRDMQASIQEADEFLAAME